MATEPVPEPTITLRVSTLRAVLTGVGKSLARWQGFSAPADFPQTYAEGMLADLMAVAVEPEDILRQLSVETIRTAVEERVEARLCDLQGSR